MEQSKEIRTAILKAIVNSGEGHLASSFSIVELLIAFGFAMQKKPSCFKLEDFVLSKGHASYAYYAWLKSENLMDDKEFETVGKLGSKLYGHLPFIKHDPRFQFGSGSLGHGLPYAVGLAVSNAIKGVQAKVCCLIGDGEANEGTLWESLLLLNKFPEAQISIMVDCNSSSERAIPISTPLENIGVCFPAISKISVNGHDVEEVSGALCSEQSQQIILCNTHKGYPCPTLIDNPIWHHRMPSEDELATLLKEIAHA